MSFKSWLVRQVSAVKEEDEEHSTSVYSEPTSTISASSTFTSPPQVRRCSLEVASRLFSRYVVPRVGTRSEALDEDVENRGKSFSEAVGNMSRIADCKMKLQNKLLRTVVCQVTPQSSPAVVRSRPCRQGMIGTPPSIAPLMRNSLNMSSLAAADCLAPQDSPDLGGSDSDEFERKRTRKQSTVTRNTEKASTRQDGAPNIKKPGLTRAATQQVLRRRNTMVRSSAQPPVDRQQLLKRGSLAIKSGAPAGESKAGPTAKAAAAPKATPGGARMGPVRLLTLIAHIPNIPFLR